MENVRPKNFKIRSMKSFEAVVSREQKKHELSQEFSMSNIESKLISGGGGSTKRSESVDITQGLRNRAHK